MKLSILFLTTCLWGVTSFGESVLKVGKNKKLFAVSHPAERNWAKGDEICVRSASNVPICGKVVKASDKMAVVKLAEPNEELASGLKVERPAKSRRSPAARDAGSSSETVVRSKRPSTNYLLGAGAHFGFNYLFPALEFQIGLTKNITLGVEPVFSYNSSGDTSATAIGGFITASYYLSRLYEKAFVQLGLGMMSVSASSTATTATVPSEKVSPIIFSALGGWKQPLGSSLLLTGAAGFQYTSSVTTTLIELNFSGLRPLLWVGLNYLF